MLFALSGFSLCALVIFFAGKRLTFYGDQLAELTGMGKAWIGMILMASVTSLPELMVGLGSVTIVGSPDLAIGDILGSCAFNLCIIAIMDAFMPGNKAVLSVSNKSHMLAAAFGIILLAMTGLGLFLENDLVLTPSLGFITLTFAVIYFLSMRTIYRVQLQEPESQLAQAHEEVKLSLKQVLLRYSLFAILIILTALSLPYFAEEIALHSGLGKSFVGTVFLAISTSLPEIAVSFAAMRMGSGEMAIGNLLGSNLFNIFILFIDDVFYTKGHLLKDASDQHIISVFFVIGMTAVALIGMIFPQQRKKWLMAADAFVIFLFYLINIGLLYLLQSS